MSEFTYQSVFPISRANAERTFAEGDSKAIADALLGLAYYDEDWRWVQDVCLRYLAGEDESLKATAATCLAHLARIHGKIDKEKVIPALRALRNHPIISGYIDDALGDIDHFLMLHEKNPS